MIDNTEEFKDKKIKDIVIKGRRALLNADFEEQMMLQIQTELEYKKEVSSHLKTSLQFFVAAQISGIGLTLAILFGKVLAQYDIATLMILALFVIAVFAILNLDNYRRLIKKYS